jgi:hypothetical protein
MSGAVVVRSTSLCSLQERDLPQGEGSSRRGRGWQCRGLWWRGPPPSDPSRRGSYLWVRVVVVEGEAGNVGGGGSEVHLPLLPPGEGLTSG